VAVVLAAGLVLPGCARPVPLAHTFESPEALGGAVLDALARKDRAALDAMALSEQEFRAYLWPHLPVSRPERNMPFDYVWSDLAGKSRAFLRARLSAGARAEGQVKRVVFDGASTRYGDVTVMRRARLVLQDAAGREQDVRAFGSVLVKDGRYKLVSYVTD
jgi:hypothetical protein